MSEPWRERVEVGDALLYLGRCEDVLRTIGRVDAIVVDPPYGIGEARGKNASRSCLSVSRDYGVEDWDDRPLEPAAIHMFLACSRWQIIFGGNYYHLPPTACWLVWDKQNGATDFADCELAWTNLPKAVRRIYWMWQGMLRKGDDPRGLHPTQKPVGVIQWCIGHLPADVETICDPCMGSGTTGVACARLGKRFIGIEQDSRYFATAVRRITEAHRQGRLFDPPRPRAEQLSLLASDMAER